MIDKYPKLVKPADVVNSIFGSGLFMLPGGRALYDEVFMVDGGTAVYLVRINPDLTITRRWIDWDTPILQMRNV